MSKAVYAGIGNVAHNISKMYVGVDGKARKVLRGYVGVDGVARKFYESNPLAYTGDFTVQEVSYSGKPCDLYTLTSSGTLTISANDARVWICGGGGNGGDSYYRYTNATGYMMSGHGGSGGYVDSNDISSGKYTVIVGSAEGKSSINGQESEIASANGGKSKNLTISNFFNHISDIKAGVDGGSGGGGACYYDGSYHRGDGGFGAGVDTIPFGIEDLKPHCAGGGAGGYFAYATYLKGGDGGTNGGDGTGAGYASAESATAGNGGDYGGGQGGRASYGSDYAMKGSSATYYGGGGGGSGVYTDTVGPGGFGYQGVVYILIPKS